MPSAPFSKILIANRGEIAVRIIKTCRRLGVKTVVVYSEADADSLAVEMADETVFIGPPPAAQSYLDADKIIAACHQTGAQAVHPGFGFLSEKAEFAQACADEGIVFIGPNPHAIQAMGDKIESKKFAAAAGVTCVPGHIGEIDSHTLHPAGSRVIAEDPLLVIDHVRIVGLDPTEFRRQRHAIGPCIEAGAEAQHRIDPRANGGHDVIVDDAGAQCHGPCHNG